MKDTAAGRRKAKTVHDERFYTRNCQIYTAAKTNTHNECRDYYAHPTNNIYTRNNYETSRLAIDAYYKGTFAVTWAPD
jgi:hypothetical protein